MKKIILFFYLILIAVIYGNDSDTNLKKLSVNNESLITSFMYNPDDIIYATVVDRETTIAAIEVILNSNNATVLYSKTLELHFGVNETKILVIAENGTTRDYILKIVRPNNNFTTWEDMEVQNDLSKRMDEYFDKELYENLGEHNYAIKKLIEWLNKQKEVVYVSVPKNMDNMTLGLTILFNSGSQLNYHIFKDRLPSFEKIEIKKYFLEDLRKTDNYTKTVKNLMDWLLNRKDIKNVQVFGEDENNIILLVIFNNGKKTKFVATKGEYLMDKYFLEQLNASGDLKTSIKKLIIWMKENNDFTMITEDYYKNMIVISMKYQGELQVEYVIRKSDYLGKWNIENVTE